MTTIALPQIAAQTEFRVATAVRDGLIAHPKWLPSWLFYDDAGSGLFEEITRLPEYYVTRTERQILAAHAADIVRQAARSLTRANGNQKFSSADIPNILDRSNLVRLRITELGAGSADKTRLLLKAAAEQQGTLIYEPVDVSACALEAARDRIEREIPEVCVCTRLMDYTVGFELENGCPELDNPAERRLVLYIGSSIGNFEPPHALRLLEGVRDGLNPGDALLLGVDLRKDEPTLLAAYDDAAGVTASFNLNMLARLNRELDADFDLDAFAHRAVWNNAESRIEMHLQADTAQIVKLPTLNLEIAFNAGETIHTENSYKYAPGQAEAMLSEAGFIPENSWVDARGWFAVCLARVP